MPTASDGQETQLLVSGADMANSHSIKNLLKMEDERVNVANTTPADPAENPEVSWFQNSIQNQTVYCSSFPCLIKTSGYIISIGRSDFV